MGAVFNVASVNNPSSAIIATPLAQAQYNFGSYNPSDPTNSAGLNAAQGAYVDPANFAGRAQKIFENGANVPTTQINGTALNGVNEYADTFLVTATPVGANTAAFLSAISSTTVTPCACDYTQWGFWSVNTGRSLNGSVSTYGDYSTAPMLWVAGVPTAAGNIPTMGTATYAGHVIADINNSGATYLAAGTFSNAVNFGTRTGAVTIGGLDGAGYSGTGGPDAGFNLVRGRPDQHRNSRADRRNQWFVFPGRPDQLHAPLWRNGRFDHPQRTQLYGKRHLRRQKTLMLKRDGAGRAARFWLARPRVHPGPAASMCPPR